MNCIISFRNVGFVKALLPSNTLKKPLIKIRGKRRLLSGWDVPILIMVTGKPMWIHGGQWTLLKITPYLPNCMEYPSMEYVNLWWYVIWIIINMTFSIPKQIDKRTSLNIDVNKLTNVVTLKSESKFWKDFYYIFYIERVNENAFR